MDPQLVERILASRRSLPRPPTTVDDGDAAEGGCGVIGMACDEPIAGRHILRSLEQMRNRGNGKGGGIAAVGLVPEEFGVTREVLERDYLVVVAYVDASARAEVEQDIIKASYEIDHVREAPRLADTSALGLDVEPPAVVQYFVRPRADVIERFRNEHRYEGADTSVVEDEFVYQTSYRLNSSFYSSEGETRAFVLSHGKDLLVLKMVAYGDDVVRAYQLEDVHAHVWIGHHRYPTKGRVWHPGGAHPFVGLHEALVHNGDFANYASVTEYLAQRNIRPLFLTDTEVSVLVFDLLHRTYGYPLEYVIEALAPTTERDFTQLAPERQAIYRQIQQVHMHGSPDGPWFFLIAQGVAGRNGSGREHRLTGITDTSMLRPQVFALHGGERDEPTIGFAASEKQAIDAALESLADEDDRFCSRPDRVWNARGGSHTDGGAFVFSVRSTDTGAMELVCTDKFGARVEPTPSHPVAAAPSTRPEASEVLAATVDEAFDLITAFLADASIEQAHDLVEDVVAIGADEAYRAWLLELLTRLMDRRYPTRGLRRARWSALLDEQLAAWVARVAETPDGGFAMLDVDDGAPEPTPSRALVIDAQAFEAEGDRSLARELSRLVEVGHRRFVVMNCRGHRFIANGFGRLYRPVRIDLYGSPGDYVGSGMQDVEVHVHANGQDQLGQILHGGKLVVHGDAGQTFLYGAKGGEAFVLGNVAGRALINAVGWPRVVINGTALDYLAESFMAGDPLAGGGFAVVNGLTFDGERWVDLPTPYPGSNLFSLASGGALYVRDPHRRLTADQLNGGRFRDLTETDWTVVRPMLEENEKLFGVMVDRLLTVDGERRDPAAVYRCIVPSKIKALQAEEVWMSRAKTKK